MVGSETGANAGLSSRSFLAPIWSGRQGVCLDDTSLAGIISVLAGHQPSFKRPKRRYAGQCNKRTGDQQLRPNRSVMSDFKPYCKQNAWYAGEADHEERRSVSRVGKGVIEIANFTRFSHRDEAVEQPPLTATRA